MRKRQFLNLVREYAVYASRKRVSFWASVARALRERQLQIMRDVGDDAERERQLTDAEEFVWREYVPQDPEAPADPADWERPLL